LTRDPEATQPWIPAFAGMTCTPMSEIEEGALLKKGALLLF
jgi:hypothetical protein